MELLLDAGQCGTLRGLRDEEPDLGAVQLPEEVDGAPAPSTKSTEQTPEQHAALLLLRRRLAGRMVRPTPARSDTPPRGFTPPC